MKVGFDPRPVMSSVYALYRGDDDAKFIDALVARGTQVVKVCLIFLILICSTLTLPKTNKAFLKNRPKPKGEIHLPTIHFQGQTVSFREGISLGGKKGGCNLFQVLFATRMSSFWLKGETLRTEITALSCFFNVFLMLSHGFNLLIFQCICSMVVAFEIH